MDFSAVTIFLSLCVHLDLASRISLDRWSGILVKTSPFDGQIECQNYNPIGTKLPASSPLSLTGLKIECDVPDNPIAEALKRLNFNISALINIDISIENSESVLKAVHFKGLTLKTLRIEFSQYDAVREEKRLLPAEPDFVKYVAEDVLLKQVKLAPFTNLTGVKHLSLTDSDFRGSWGGCEDMLSLKTLRYFPWGYVPEQWLATCSQLQTLRIWECNDAEQAISVHILARILRGAKSLKEIDISKCGIKVLPDAIADLVNLEVLSLPYNQLVTTPAIELLPSLKRLDISSNGLRFNMDFTLRSIQSTPTLEAAIFDKNPRFDFCSFAFGRVEGYNLSHVRHLSLADTGTSWLCFEEHAMDSLQKLDLRNCPITTLRLKGFPKSKAAQLVMDFAGTITRVEMDQHDYKALHPGITITGLLLDQLSCDCKNGWFARALRENKLIVRDYLPRCSTIEGDYNVKLLTKVQPDQLECEKKPCAEGCVCETSWSHDFTDVTCDAGKLSAVPRISNLRSLYAPRNRVKTLEADDLPDTLITLDISNNSLIRIEEEAVTKLFSVSQRRVNLSRNPFVCECSARAFVTALQTHSFQVEDIDEVMCEDGRTLRDLSPYDLCIVQLASAASGVLLALSAAVGALCYRYKFPIRVYLYTRGWCLCCVRENETKDMERPYDAFISFSHDDFEVVTEKLLPGLETEPPFYKVCVHFRDWMPGELIHAQISQSVRQSRRTIIVLSRNFVKSVWGLVEFRTAYMSSLSEGRVRLIIVVLDDVLDDETLDPDLKDYVNQYTYVHVEDKWFWRKMRYALPHRTAASLHNDDFLVENIAAGHQGVDNINYALEMGDVRSLEP